MFGFDFGLGSLVSHMLQLNHQWRLAVQRMNLGTVRIATVRPPGQNDSCEGIRLLPCPLIRYYTLTGTVTGQLDLYLPSHSSRETLTGNLNELLPG